MARYVPDISTLRWVIISPQRTARPDEFATKTKSCPFCVGNEAISKEVLRYGEGSPKEPGWKLRVIANKYPITDYHEVIIHSPDEEKDLDEFDLSQIELLFRSYRERFNFYREKGKVLIFCNRGEHAGASIKHPHSQLVVIPNQITLETLKKEPINNSITETDNFNVYCPDFSQWPYEVWITPKKDSTLFGDITDTEITDISMIMKTMIIRIKKIYQGKPFTMLPFAYNYYIYPDKNWYLRLIPRFIHKAGFELGTGLNVNIIDPKNAAEDLRDDKVLDMLDKLQMLQK